MLLAPIQLVHSNVLAMKISSVSRAILTYASLVIPTTVTMAQTVDALTTALQMVADVQAAGNWDLTDDNADHHNTNSHSPAHQSKSTGNEPWTIGPWFNRK